MCTEIHWLQTFKLEGGISNNMKDLQAHTFEMTHKISANEAKFVCNLFKEPYSTDVHINSPPILGINQIHIKRNPVYLQGKVISYIHTITLEVNVGRLLKLSNVSMTDLSKANVQAMFKKLDFMLSNKFHLLSQNSCSADWTLSRLDCGLDVKMDTDDKNILKEHMYLLHRTFNPKNNRGCEFTPFKGYDAANVMYESITLNNKYYRYNIYYKLLQLEKEYGNKLLPKERDEIKDIIRVEKQLKGKALTNAIGSPRKLSLLLDEDIVSNVMKTMVSDMKFLFGSGVHATYDEAIRVIDSSKYPRDVKLNLKLLYANADTFGYAKTLSNLVDLAKGHGADDKTVNIMQTLIDKRRKQIEALGIAIAGLNDKVAPQVEKTVLNNINDSIQKMLKAKIARRSKGSFCRFSFDAPNKRYRCNPTLHDINGKRRISVAGKSLEEAEMNVLYKIREFLNANLRIHKNDEAARRNCLIVTRQDVEHFKMVIDRPEMLAILDDVLNQLNGRINTIDAPITNVELKEEHYDGEEPL